MSIPARCDLVCLCEVDFDLGIVLELTYEQIKSKSRLIGDVYSPDNDNIVIVTILGFDELLAPEIFKITWYVDDVIFSKYEAK